MEYKLKTVHLNADNPTDVDFPDLKDRIIEKRGDVWTFTLNEIEANTVQLLKTRKELQAKHDYEKVIKENIEEHHPFVKELSEQDLLTVWMYKQSKGHIEMCSKKIALIDAQLESDKKEIAEIYEQIPELKGVLSGEVVEGEVKMLENEES